MSFALKPCMQAITLVMPLLAFSPVYGQTSVNPFIMLIFVRSPTEAWTMNAGESGSLAVCHQTGNTPADKHKECRHGTQSQDAYAQLKSLAMDLRAVQNQPGVADPNGAQVQIIVSQFGGMRFDRSKVETNAKLKQLVALMVEANRRVGGDEFVPHF